MISLPQLLSEIRVFAALSTFVGAIHISSLISLFILANFYFYQFQSPVGWTLLGLQV